MSEKEQEFSLKSLFIPLTTLKAIHWIIIIGIIVYANMLFNGFVWDDIFYIINNHDVHSFNIDKLIGPNSFNSYGYYRPIPAIYFALLYNFFEQSSFPYHLLSLLLHIINTSLLYVYLKKFIEKHIAFVLTLLFLIHPMQVESVSFISSIANILYFTFGIMALLILLQDKLTNKRSLSVGSLYLLSLLTKETGLLFLLYGLVYTLLFNKKNIKQISIISCCTFIIYFVIRVTFVGIHLGATKILPISSLSLGARLVNTPEIFLYYMQTFIYPGNLAIDQQWVIKQITFVQVVFPTIVLLLFLLILGIVGRKLYNSKQNRFIKQYIFFTCWFLLGMSMYLQILPLDMTVADRWFYTPMVGLLAIGGIIYSSIKDKLNKIIKETIVFIILLIIVIFSVRTITRNTNWTDNMTLFHHDSQVTTSFSLETNYGNEYLNLDDYKNAKIHLEKSVFLLPMEVNVNDLALTYQRLGDYHLAKKYYELSLRVPGNREYDDKKYFLNTYITYGAFLAGEDNPQKAIILLNQGLKDYPNTPNLLLYLAISEYKLNHYSDAQIAINQAYMLSPTPYISYVYNQIANHLPIQFKY